MTNANDLYELNDALRNIVAELGVDDLEEDALDALLDDCSHDILRRLELARTTRGYAAIYVDGSGSTAYGPERDTRKLVVQVLQRTRTNTPLHSFSTYVNDDVNTIPAQGTNISACVDHSRTKYGPNSRILVVVDSLNNCAGGAPDRVTVKSFHEILET